MAHDALKSFQANLSFADVIVSIHAGAEWRLRVVHVNDENAIEAYRQFQTRECLFEAFGGVNWKSCLKQMGGVDAYAEINFRRAFDNCGQLFKF